MQLNHPIDEQSKLPMEELVEQQLLGFLLIRIRTNYLPILEIKIKQEMQVYYPIDVHLKTPMEVLVVGLLPDELLLHNHPNRLPIFEIQFTTWIINS
jgi:hypothetical protein